jgi:ankyrin repeat protein
MNYAPKGYFNCVYGEAAIREAAGTGQTGIIRWLLDSGVDPYCTRTRSDVFNVWAYTHGAPPLLIAARSGHTEAAVLLLDVVTDFDYVRSQEESPVIGFVLKKQTALLESILRRGIDVDQRDIHGQTALFYTVLDESISCVRLLLEFGADINASSSHQFTPHTPVCCRRQRSRGSRGAFAAKRSLSGHDGGRKSDVSACCHISRPSLF